MDAPVWVDINKIEDLEPFYLSVLPKIREAARKCGYAVGVHGSLRRDLDLIAAPWVDSFADKNELASSIHLAACGMKMYSYGWENKPNGRIATSFPICWINYKTIEKVPPGLGHIDLSVVGSVVGAN